MDALRAQLLGYFSQNVRTTARSLIRFEGSIVARQQDLLVVEAARIEESRSDEDLQSACGQVEKVLGEHRERGESHLAAMRENLSSTGKVLQSVLTQISGAGAAHHNGLETDLDRLRDISHMEEIDRLRAALRETTERMSQRLAVMKREHQLVITQLRDEIRILHEELDVRQAAEIRATRSSAPVPAAPQPASEDSGARATEPASPPAPAVEIEVPEGMRRAEFEEVLRVKADQDEPYALAIILLSNLADLFAEHEPALVLSLLDSAARSVVEGFVGNPFWIRWEDDCFLLCTHYRGTAAAAWADDLAERVSGPRMVRAGSSSANLTLQINAATLDSATQETPASILGRTSELIRSLRSSA